MGWTSPVMPRLRNVTADSPLKFGIGHMEEGWISATLAIGALIGCPVAGPLSNRIGRKWALLVSAFSYAAAYFLFLLTSTIWHLYVGRLLQGIAMGLTCTVMPMYISEITTDANRGPIGTLMTFFLLCGVLYVYTAGAFLSYLKLQFCCLAVPIVFFLLFFFMPETPYFYAMKRRKSAAVRSLEFLRCKCGRDIENELRQIQAAVDADMAQKGTLPQILRNKPNRRAFFICCGLLAFQQLCGIDAVIFNVESIFISAKTPLNPAISSIIVVVVQIGANLVTPFIVERVGRKKILLMSSLGMCFAQLVLGSFFYVEAVADASAITWTPIPALMLLNAMFSIGFGPVPWVILSEILPTNIKATVSSFSTTVGWVITLVLVRFFPTLNALGSYYTFWMFGGLCGLAFIFVLVVVIETKGLSLQEIQEKLS